MNLTPTERKILDILDDGNRHPIVDLQACVNDDLADECCLRVHLSNLRKKLRRVGKDIISEFRDRKSGYRQVRRLQNASEE